jgi:hypothetical protein
MTDRIKHFIDYSATHLPNNRAAFQALPRLEGFVECNYVNVCKWHEVIVIKDSPCDVVARQLSMHKRKEKP